MLYPANALANGQWWISVNQCGATPSGTLLGASRIVSPLGEVVAEAGFQPAKRFKRIGIPDTFPHGYGSQASMMTRYEITAERTIGVALDLLAVRTASTN